MHDRHLLAHYDSIVCYLSSKIISNSAMRYLKRKICSSLGYSQQMTAAEPFLFHLLSNKCNNYKKPFCTCRQWIDVQIHKRKHHSKLNLYPVKCTHVDLPASFLNIEKDTSDNASAHKWGETKREAKSKKEAEGWRWTKYETSIGGYLITTWLG